MRLVMIAPYPYDASNIVGGGMAVTYFLVSALSQLPDLDVHVLVSTRDVAKDTDREIDGVHVHYLSVIRILPRMVSMVLLDRRKLRHWIKKLSPDVVHVQVEGRDAFSVLGAFDPIIVTPHGLWHGAEGKADKRRLREILRGWALSYMRKYFLDNVKHLVAISPYVVQSIKEQTNAKVYPIENPVKQAFFNLENDVETGRILYVGSIEPRKGLLNLIKALPGVVREVPHVVLRIVGPVSDQEYFRVCQAFVTEGAIQTNVEFIGPLDQDHILDEYAKCEFLVLPSAAETAPMVISEAMAAGKPCIGTRVGGIPYLIADNETGYVVEYGDVDALALRIISLLKNREFCQRMGNRAREQAIHRFRADMVAKAHMEAYQDVLR